MEPAFQMNRTCNPRNLMAPLSSWSSGGDDPKIVLASSKGLRKSFNSSSLTSTGSIEDFHFIPGTPSSCLIIFIVFLEIASFVPSFQSSCCSVLKFLYLSLSSEISNAFVLVLRSQQALLLLDHHFDHHPRGLLLLPTAHTEFDLLERKPWSPNFFPFPRDLLSADS
ncbi:hypothetical protein M5K25_025639 [Dendrobium thyrsiflorum]|uniref:Uncharacterized protein n=1 Tax=Dendrobium thyrsiflorum TaxID=117978 RepID=A0ABD0U4K6_DENTH